MPSPPSPLDFYAHLFDARDHADRLATIPGTSFGNILEPSRSSFAS